MKLQTQQLVGIIGHPLGHTLSPAMHTAAFKHLQLPFVFGVLDVTEEILPALIAALRISRFVGASVTVPHKQHVITLLDELSDEAAALGAVNTLLLRNGRLTGHNTDIIGLQQTLLPVGSKIRGANALVLGAGGAARAVLYALSKEFAPRKIWIYNRTRERSAALLLEFQKLFPGIIFGHAVDESELRSACSDSALIVNATSLGMSPDVESSPLPSEIRFSNHQIFLDIVYNPIETVLLRRARRDGAHAINGVEMLVQQGAAAFQLWTGKAFPVDVGRRAVTEALKGR